MEPLTEKILGSVWGMHDNEDRILVWEVPTIGPLIEFWLYLSGCHWYVSEHSIIQFVGIQKHKNDTMSGDQRA